MGLEELNNVLGHFTVLFRSGSSVAGIFAWIGIILIAIVLIYYISVGFVKLTKAFLRMKVKYLGLVLMIVGIIFIALSIVIP
jgi:hypothetical protein